MSILAGMRAALEGDNENEYYNRLASCIGQRTLVISKDNRTAYIGMVYKVNKQTEEGIEVVSSFVLTNIERSFIRDDNQRWSEVFDKKTVYPKVAYTEDDIDNKLRKMNVM